MKIQKKIRGGVGSGWMSTKILSYCEIFKKISGGRVGEGQGGCE